MPSIPQPLDPGDDGSAAPEVATALQGYSAGTTAVRDVLTALGGTRLLVPVVAVLVSGDETGEKDSEMVLPKLIGKDGRAAVLAFTSTGAMVAWRPDARPVQVRVEDAARAAVQEDAAALVIDVAGPVTFAIEGFALGRVAGGEPPAQPYDDPDIAALAVAAGRRIPGVAKVGLAPSADADLTVRLRVTPGHDPRAVARQLSEGLGRDLAGHAPRGIELIVENL